MSDKGTYYLIHEVSELSGLSLSQLRYYERIGLVVPERDEKNKYRKYSPEDIYILASLRNLLRTRLPPRLIKQIAERSHGAVALKEPTLYTAFKRLTDEGLIDSYWGDEPSGARRKYYRLTIKGRVRLENDQHAWRETREVLDLLLTPEQL